PCRIAPAPLQSRPLLPVPRQSLATTPQGPWPTVTLPITVSVWVSTTDTSPEGPLAVRRRVPSALSASPQGRAPTATSPISVPSCGEITATVPPRPVLTYSRPCAASSATPMGRASLRSCTSCVV